MALRLILSTRPSEINAVKEQHVWYHSTMPPNWNSITPGRFISAILLALAVGGIIESATSSWMTLSNPIPGLLVLGVLAGYRVFAPDD
jgi:uncharacterized protein (DUF2062 family)